MGRVHALPTGNVTRAAELAGVNRRSLQRLIVSLGISKHAISQEEFDTRAAGDEQALRGRGFVGIYVHRSGRANDA